MGFDTTMAVLYAQSALGTPFTNAAAVAPQAAAAMSKVLAAELAKQEQKQIEKAQESAKTNLSKDGHRGSSFGTRRRGRLSRPKDDEDAEEAASSPLVGNLLNLKV
ncbi:MAG: hypothetical protein J5838_07760 [Desulfovibrio sp.]|nr:hypothetical protein [Desulfovibrio sp.]